MEEVSVLEKTGWRFSFSVEVLEVYNEKIKDLLADRYTHTPYINKYVALNDIKSWFRQISMCSCIYAGISMIWTHTYIKDGRMGPNNY